METQKTNRKKPAVADKTKPWFGTPSRQEIHWALFLQPQSLQRQTSWTAGDTA